MAARVPAGLFLTLEDCALMCAALRLGVRQLGHRDGAVPERLVRLAEEVHREAREFTANAQATAWFRTTEDEEADAAAESGAQDRLTVQQAAKRYGVTESYLYRQVRKGALVRAESDNRTGTILLDSASVAAWAAGRSRTKAA
jgi:hypothetical protein